MLLGNKYAGMHIYKRQIAYIMSLIIHFRGFPGSKPTILKSFSQKNIILTRTATLIGTSAMFSSYKQRKYDTILNFTIYSRSRHVVFYVYYSDKARRNSEVSSAVTNNY